MTYKYLLSSNRIILYNKMNKVIDHLIRETDLNNILLRTDLLDLSMKIMDILEEYDKQVGDKKEY